MPSLLNLGKFAKPLTRMQNKELEASEERKRKAKQLELQRKEAARTNRGIPSRPPSYPIYTPPTRPAITETIDTYEAEKKKTFAKYGYFPLELT